MNNIFITFQTHLNTKTDSKPKQQPQWHIATEIHKYWNHWPNLKSTLFVSIRNWKTKQKKPIKPQQNIACFIFCRSPSIREEKSIGFRFFFVVSVCNVNVGQTQWMCNINNHDLWSCYRLLGWLQRLDFVMAMTFHCCFRLCYCEYFCCWCNRLFCPHSLFFSLSLFFYLFWFGKCSTVQKCIYIRVKVAWPVNWFRLVWLGFSRRFAFLSHFNVSPLSIFGTFNVASNSDLVFTVFTILFVEHIFLLS